MKPVLNNHVGSGSFSGMVIKSRLNQSRMGMILDMLAKKYNAPETAALREYVSNSTDSHRSSGVTCPVEVTLPTSFSPELIIQDFGLGMSSEELVEIYSGFGFSTKDDSDDDIGGFGIGSKSALAISNQFSVVSVKDGLKNMLVATRENGDILYKFAIQDAVTTDPNGVTVTIPIRNIAEYSTENALKVLTMWKVSQVKVLNNEEANKRIADMWIETEKGYINPEIFEFKEQGQYNYRNRNGNIVAVGPVAYPTLVNYTRDESFRNQLTFSIYSVPKLKIHEIEVSQSREVIEKNIENEEIINARYKELYLDASDIFEEKLSECKTMLDAVKLKFSEMGQIFEKEITFQGVVVPKTVKIEKSELISITPDNFSSARSKRRISLDSVTDSKIALNRKIDFVIVLDKTSTSSATIRSSLHEIITEQNKNYDNEKSTQTDFRTLKKGMITETQEEFSDLLIVGKFIKVSEILELAKDIRAKNRAKNKVEGLTEEKSRNNDIGNRKLTIVTPIKNRYEQFLLKPALLSDLIGVKNVVFFQRQSSKDFRTVGKRDAGHSSQHRLLSDYILSIPEEERPTFVMIGNNIKSLAPYLEYVEGSKILPEKWIAGKILERIKVADKKHNGAVVIALKSSSTVSALRTIKDNNSYYDSSDSITSLLSETVRELVIDIEPLVEFASVHYQILSDAGIKTVEPENDKHFALYSILGRTYLLRLEEEQKKVLANYVDTEMLNIINSVK